MWTARYSNYYLEQLHERRYRGRTAAIEKAIDNLLEEPYVARGGERLRHNLVGLRSAHIDKGDRVIYRICRECRELGDRPSLSLDCCLSDEWSETVVNILCLSDHYESFPLEFDFDLDR